MTVRERFVSLFKDSGLTQAEIARRVGEDYNWVNNRIRGYSTIKGDDIPRLARAVRVPPAAFFDEPGQDDSASATMVAELVERLRGVPESEIELMMDLLRVRSLRSTAPGA